MPGSLALMPGLTRHLPSMAQVRCAPNVPGMGTMGALSALFEPNVPGMGPMGALGHAKGLYTLSK